MPLRGWRVTFGKRRAVDTVVPTKPGGQSLRAVFGEAGVGVGWGERNWGKGAGGRLGVGLLLSPPQDANLHPFSTPRGLEKKREKVFILLESKKIPLLHSVKK